jgi:rfaE bifunctional protein kinase chain/domain
MASDIFAGIKRPAVCVWGDICLDEYIFGEVEAITKEAPVPALFERRCDAVPGQCGNVANNLSALGTNVKLLSCWGKDGSGEQLSQILTSAGIDTSHCIISPDLNTTHRTKLVHWSAQKGYHHLYHIYREMQCPPQVASQLLKNFTLQRLDCQVLVLSDYSLGVFPEELVSEIITQARGFGIPLIINTRRSIKSFRNVNGIICNLQEVNRALGYSQAGGEPDFKEIADGVQRLLVENGWRWVLLTLGRDGMFLVSDASRTLPNGGWHLPPVVTEVVDITGAGDTVVAAMALAEASGLPPEKGMVIANLSAGVAVGKPGTSTASREEIMKLSAGH